MNGYERSIGIAVLVAAAMAAGLYVGSKDGRAKSYMPEPDWRTRPEHVVEPYGSKSGTPTHYLPDGSEPKPDRVIPSPQFSFNTLKEAGETVTLSGQLAAKMAELQSSCDATSATVATVRKEIKAIDPRIIDALRQLDGVNRAQNEAIGKIIFAVSPDGVLDDGKSTNTLHAHPAGGFELKGRE